jgi:hypothetical protein
VPAAAQSDRVSDLVLVALGVAKGDAARHEVGAVAVTAAAPSSEPTIELVYYQADDTVLCDSVYKARLLVLRRRLAAIDCGVTLERVGRGRLELGLEPPAELTEVPTGLLQRAAHGASGT